MIAWSNYEAGNHRVTCPACGRGERDKTLGVTIDADGAGVAHCFRCSLTESYRPDRGAHLAIHGTPRIKAVATSTHDTLSAYGRDLWSASKPLSGVALDYLNARQCRIPPADGDLRYHASLKHPSGYVGPALVALITDVVIGEPMSLHRTWIRADGRKADIDTPRLLLGGHRKQGGVIRLWPDDAVTGGLGISEGIETALSLAWGYLPVWSCVDAGNLKALPRLPGIESLTIGADKDPAGLDAARACAQRWTADKCEVYLTQQKENDLNDTIKAAA
jgi:putative DNA primase/helicase